jgi:cobalamin biosynthesis Mg chelatase CobN
LQQEDSKHLKFIDMIRKMEYSDFSFKDVVSVMALGVPTSVIEKVTGSGTTANKVVSLALTGNPNLISGTKKAATVTTPTPEVPTATQTAAVAATAAEKQKTTMYIICGVVAVVVLGVLVYIFKK